MRALDAAAIDLGIPAAVLMERVRFGLDAIDRSAAATDGPTALSDGDRKAGAAAVVIERMMTSRNAAGQPPIETLVSAQRVDVGDQLGDLLVAEDRAPVRHADDRRLADHAAGTDDLGDVLVAKLAVEPLAHQRRDHGVR